MSARRPNLVGLTQAAELLGVSRRTLEDWRRDRRNLTFIQVGRGVRVDVAEIVRYVAARAQPARPAVAEIVATGVYGGVLGRVQKWRKS